MKRLLPAALMLLAACAGGRDPRVPEAGLVPLEAGALRAVLLGHRLERSGGSGIEAFDYVGIHRPDGTMTGTARAVLGTETDTGVWEIDAGGLYCRQWSGRWGGGARGCFRVARSGDVAVFVRADGAERYAYRLVPAG